MPGTTCEYVSRVKATLECPFTNVEEVWGFDAVKEYGLPGTDEQVAAYERVVQYTRENNPEQLVITFLQMFQMT